MLLFQIWRQDVRIEILVIGDFYLVLGKTVLIIVQGAGGAA